MNYAFFLVLVAVAPSIIPPCKLFGCDDGNPCTSDTCTTYGCYHEALPGGSPCEDGACVGSCFPPLLGPDGEVIEYGSCDCLGQPVQCVIDPQCDDGIPCTMDVCQAGICSNDPMFDGWVCSVGDCRGTCTEPWWNGEVDFAGCCRNCEADCG